MSGKWTSLPTPEGDTLRAFVAQPPQGSGPGVLLLHDGNPSSFEWLAEVLGEEGYCTLLPEQKSVRIETAAAALRATS